MKAFFMILSKNYDPQIIKDYISFWSFNQAGGKVDTGTLLESLQ